MKSLMSHLDIFPINKNDLFYINNFLKKNFNFEKESYSNIDDIIVKFYKPFFKKNYLENNNLVLVPFIQDWGDIDFLSILLSYYKKNKITEKIYVCNTQLLHENTIDIGFSVNLENKINGVDLKNEAKFRYDYSIIFPQNFSFSIILNNDDDLIFAIDKTQILKIISKDVLKSYYNKLDFKSDDLYLEIYKNFCNCSYYKDFFLIND
mgnify:FL=1